MARLLYQGHGSYRLESKAGTVVYVDPYMDPEGPRKTSTYQEPADLILITHQHFDHTAYDLPAKKPNCAIWENYDLHPKRGEYLTKTFKDIRVEATVAVNVNHPIDECVGYLIWMDDVLIYGAGDTSETRQMTLTLKNLPIDYALLPADGIYNMDVKAAAHCAEIIGARHTIPIHLKPVEPFGEKQAQEFAALAPSALIVHPGDELELVHA
ncbi:MAG: MBL fold metallo-hydrolase [Atopobiaceae bacterium]|jgi:L-ascorbate metabolism protein UlaG (beta-lactamase superfamily)